MNFLGIYSLYFLSLDLLTSQFDDVLIFKIYHRLNSFPFLFGGCFERWDVVFIITCEKFKALPLASMSQVLLPGKSIAGSMRQ